MHNIPKASENCNSGDVGSSLDTAHLKNCWRRLVNILANGFFHNAKVLCPGPSYNRLVNHAGREVESRLKTKAKINKKLKERNKMVNLLRQITRKAKKNSSELRIIRALTVKAFSWEHVAEIFGRNISGKPRLAGYHDITSLVETGKLKKGVFSRMKV